jgi:hypothetical protein
MSVKTEDRHRERARAWLVEHSGPVADTDVESLADELAAAEGPLWDFVRSIADHQAGICSCAGDTRGCFQAICRDCEAMLDQLRPRDDAGKDGAR